MTFSPPFPLVAVDIGNSRIKFGLFETLEAATPKTGLPVPACTLNVEPTPERMEEIASWLGDKFTPGALSWHIGSVQRNVAAGLVDWLRRQDAGRIKLLTADDLPLGVRVPHPDRVGIDRLLCVTAANRLRANGVPAVVVGLGTAITVNLVSPAGEFLGGAILPGIGMSARALHEFTDLLPLLDMKALAEPPPALGLNTAEAMRSGMYWGAVGGVKQLIELLSRSVDGAPEIYLTGGAAPAVAGLLGARARYEPHLTLAGIVLAAVQ